MSDVELSNWPTKPAAAATLQCSVRVLERRIQAGLIEVRRGPQTKPGVRGELVCNPADVSKLLPPAFTMPPAEAGAIATAANGALAQAGPPSLHAIAALLAATAGAFQHQPQRMLAEQKLWLTPEEAEEVSGLSKNFLKRECRAGNLTAVRDGRKWKIQRQALERFNGAGGAK